jgi:hypothetical protein
MTVVHRDLMSAAARYTLTLAIALLAAAALPALAQA